MRPTDPPPPGPQALSRRSFLIAGAAAGIAAGLSLPAAPAAARPAERAAIATERPHRTLLGVL
jgi:hypothetical protein